MPRPTFASVRRTSRSIFLVARRGRRFASAVGLAVVALVGFGCSPPPPASHGSPAAAVPKPSPSQQRDRARALARGEGREADPEAAARMFRDLCREGDGESCFAYGEAMERGLGADADEAAALDKFLKACEAGYLLGCTKAGLATLAGRGTEPNPSRAGDVLRQACVAGEVYACARWAVMQQRGELGRVDLHAAAQTWRQACDLSAAFCDEFGDILRVGDVVPREPALAAARYDEACERGEAYGCRALGGMLASGDASGFPDLERARAAFSKACALGDRPACAHKQRLEAPSGAETPDVRGGTGSAARAG
ncbi:MAG: sel1 repeat family protein [Myxococcales bacterium FL481]|nr:MAG: sel1 repeat family protein [Myxococcales bacterium FL481]